MISRTQSTALCLAVGLSLGLSACGGGDGGSNATAGTGAATPAAATGSAATPTETANAKVPNLSEGPDVCFRAIAKHLGADVKVSEINSFFSSGSEIDSTDDEPLGQLTVCSVQYQNPSDPRKLLSSSLDLATGTFDTPKPVEITVMGGDASKFNLEDHLIPLSKVNAAGLKAVMDAQKPKLDGVYSRYAWSGVRLSSPDSFSNTHTLRLDVDGRLKSNDIKESGYASVSTDGTTVTKNFLLP
ncbi:MAG: hypothetical protein ABW182_06310 [Sphingomonas sp.]